jgi:hypothetical protein
MQLKENLANGTLSLRDLDNKVSQPIEFLESKSFKAKQLPSIVYTIILYYYFREEPDAGECTQRRQELWIGNRRENKEMSRKVGKTGRDLRTRQRKLTSPTSHTSKKLKWYENNKNNPIVFIPSRFVQFV